MKNRKRKILITGSLLIAIFICFQGCTSVDVFEKNVRIPGQSWEYAFKPSVTFNVTDTTALYNIFVVLRHTNSYNYTNIWLEVDYQLPADSLRKQKLEVQLASNENGWLGKGMDDIYEIRKLITPQPYQFKKSGPCTFTLSQIMRDNPLPYVMNAGIRVEKVH
ncbi:MAG: hypothetical protein C5B52_12110 [Bacteroidetes bacterium]|nr:MAG: hypothetical protein C5B52_12110 [Bacteroidota bacterium]